MTTQPKEKKQDWEKELRKKFCVTKNNHPHCEEAYDFEVIEADPEEMEDFISSLLEQTREETIKRVMDVRPKEKLKLSDNEFVQGYDDGFNQALNWWIDNITKLTIKE